MLLTTGAIGCGLALLIVTASFFVKPLQSATGWSRSEIALGTTLSHFSLAFVYPVIGAIATRFGVGKVSVTSMAVYGLGCLAMAAIPTKLVLYYIMVLSLALLSCGTSSAVLGELVAERFVRWRGTVLGIALSGPSIILIPLAPVMIAAVNDISWRAGYVVLGISALLIGVPCAHFAAKGRRAVSRSGDGVPGPQVTIEEAQGMSWIEAVRTVDYWILFSGAVTSATPLGGFLGQLAAMLSDKGMSVVQVGWLASTFTFAILCGRIAMGLLLDVIYPWLAAGGAMFGAAIGALLLLNSVPSPLTCCIAMVLVGSAMGGDGLILGFFTARQFGMKGFSTIFCSFGSATVIGFGLGASIFGKLYDLDGNYQLTLMLAAGAFALSGILFASTSRGPSV